MKDPTTRLMRHDDGERRFSTLAVVLALAAGFLVGVVLVAALGGAKGTTSTETVAVTVTETVEAPTTQTNPGTVVVTTPVPELVGQPLDVAKERIARSQFDVDVVGGGLLGVIVDDNWTVVAQEPAAGTELELGSTLRVEIERR